MKIAQCLNVRFAINMINMTTTLVTNNLSSSDLLKTKFLNGNQSGLKTLSAVDHCIAKKKTNKVTLKNKIPNNFHINVTY